MLENKAIYKITVIPIIGDPTLVVRLANVPQYPVSISSSTYDFVSRNPEGKNETVTISYDDRTVRYSFCESGGYYKNGGDRSCGFYIGVECEQECIYNITL